MKALSCSTLLSLVVYFASSFVEIAPTELVLKVTIPHDDNLFELNCESRNSEMTADCMYNFSSFTELIPFEAAPNNKLKFYVSPENESVITCLCNVNGQRVMSTSKKVAAIQFASNISTLNIFQDGRPNVTLHCPLVIGNLHQELDPYKILWEEKDGDVYKPIFSRRYNLSNFNRNLTITKSGITPTTFRCALQLKRCDSCQTKTYGRTYFLLNLIDVIGFINAPYTVNERDGMATMTIGFLSGNSSQVDVTISVSFFNGSAIALQDHGDEFYILNADNPSAIVYFIIENDNIYEVTKLVEAKLSFVGDQPAHVTIAPENARIYILDDEVLDFRFDPQLYSISKDIVNVSLKLHLFSGNIGDIGIILGASIASSYNLRDVTFERNDILKFVELTILSDGMTKRPMDFKVKLSVITYTNGQAVPDEDKKRIYLGDAHVTIGTPLSIPIVVGATIGLVVLLIIAGLICIPFALLYAVRRRRKLSPNQAQEHENIRASFNEDLNEVAELRLHGEQSSFKLNISKHLMINCCNLKMNEIVGQGQYGVVYRGQLCKGFSKGCTEVVAVKTLKGFLDKSLLRGLLEESSRMSTFDHPNVLTLTGVCMDGGQVPYIVMPFMFNGSLISYLTKAKSELYFSPNYEMDEKITHASCKLMDFSLQIAKGMEYLTSKMIIHRDLAARNCMVDLHLVVKVSDFGLSESINPSKDYFRHQEKDVKLPFKWMAPESLGNGIFSEKTDVWSYGVTCWEVFSAGKSPHAGVNATDLYPMLENGYRMDKPNNKACSDIMYNQVIMKCWEMKPENRPKFSELVPLVSSLLEANAGYICFNESTIPELITATADAETKEMMTAVESGDSIQIVDATAIENNARYVTTSL